MVGGRAGQPAVAVPAAARRAPGVRHGGAGRAPPTVPARRRHPRRPAPRRWTSCGSSSPVGAAPRPPLTGRRGAPHLLTPSLQMLLHAGMAMIRHLSRSGAFQGQPHSEALCAAQQRFLPPEGVT